MSNRLKRFVSLTLASVIFIGFSQAPQVNADSDIVLDVSVYSLSEKNAKYISIPSEYPTEYQLDFASLGFTETGTPIYRPLSPTYASNHLGYTVSYYDGYNDDAVNISEDGLITPATWTLYWEPNGNGTSIEPAEYVSKEVRSEVGDVVMWIIIGSESRYVHIHNIDYGAIYVEEKTQEFLEGKNPQTAWGAADLGAQFAASFKYGIGTSHADEMIIRNEGDCWASSDMVITIAKRYGYNAWRRNGRKDAGAGSMHENAMVEDTANGKWYEVEAGFESYTTPRRYEIRERSSLFSYRMNSDNRTIEVYSYDAEFKKDTETSISFPEAIDGKTVTSISKNFMEDPLYDCLGIENVTIPKTITNIGQSAFWGCEKLKDVYYEGTENEWNAITIASGNDYLTNATIHYNSYGLPEPTVTDTPTPEPTVTDTPTPEPTVTDAPTPTITDAPTPEPTVTDVPEPTVTDVPEPTVTDVPEPTLAETHAQVRANSLLLKDKIGVKFLTYLPDEFIADEGARAEINGQVCAIGAKDDRGRYPIVYTVAAAQMRDEVVLKLYRGDGTEYPLLDKNGIDVTDNGCVYSVQDYINEVSATGSGLDTDEKLMMLLNRMEDFGTFAQLYFEYNDDNVVFSSGYSDIRNVSSLTLQTYKATIDEVSDSGIKRTGSSLSLKTATQINHKFVLDEGRSIEDYKFYVDGKLVTTKSKGNVVLRYEASSGKYVLSIKEIVAAKLHESHSVVVKDSEDNAVITIENYSALSYAYAVIYNDLYDGPNDTKTDYLVYLMKCLYLYNRAAVDYFGV